MKKINELLLKPEYFYRPIQILRRIDFSLRRPTRKSQLRMPWGSMLSFFPSEVIGRSLYTFGLYDLALSEALWRLIDEGDTVLDVGANIGYTTSLMSKKVGPKGKVISFEPHPLNLELLKENMAQSCYQNIDLFPCALSDEDSEVELYIPENFTQNRGVATLEKREGASSFKVKAKRLDEVLTSPEKIKLMKIDVEGHELSVFKGAEKLFQEKKIECILFEEHNIEKSLCVNYLKSHGFNIWRLNKTFKGPLLNELSDRSLELSYEPANFIAFAHDQLKQRFQESGYTLYSA